MKNLSPNLIPSIVASVPTTTNIKQIGHFSIMRSDFGVSISPEATERKINEMIDVLNNIALYINR